MRLEEDAKTEILATEPLINFTPRKLAILIGSNVLTAIITVVCFFILYKFTNCCKTLTGSPNGVLNGSQSTPKELRYANYEQIPVAGLYRYEDDSEKSENYDRVEEQNKDDSEQHKLFGEETQQTAKKPMEKKTPPTGKKAKKMLPAGVGNVGFQDKRLPLAPQRTRTLPGTGVKNAPSNL